MTFPFHWVSAHKLVSLQARIHINFVMDSVSRLLKTHCIPWWFDLFCQLKWCVDNGNKMKLRCWIWCAESNHRNEGPVNGVLRPLIEKLYAKKINKWLKWHLWRKLWVSRNNCTLFYGIRNHRTQFLYAIFHCRIGVFIYERSRVEDRMKSERKKEHTE